MSLGRITSSELIWLAGYLEGEGYFGRYPNEGGRCGSWKIGAQSTDKDVLERVAKSLNVKVGGPYTSFSTQLQTRRRPTYNITLARRLDVIDIITRLQPHMGERRVAQIQLLLDAHYACV